MRIAHISLHGDPLEPLGSIEAGGQNVYVKNAALQLAARGYKVDVFTRWNDLSKPRIEPFGENARVVRLHGGPKSFIKKEQTLKLLDELAEDFSQFKSANSLDYGLLHSHYYIEGAFGLRLSQRLKVPQVHTFHSLGRIKLNHELLQGNPDSAAYAERLGIEKAVMAQARTLVATSPSEATDFAQWYAHHCSNVRVVPCGLDPQIFRPLPREDARAKLGLPAERKIVLYVGRLDPRKGLETLLFAFRKMLYDFRPFGRELMLVVVGGRLGGLDWELEHYRELAGELRMPLAEKGKFPRGCVMFAGSLQQADVADYYSAADVVVVPSYYEPFGMVAIEAQACGTPVVASAVGGLKFAVEQGRGGLWAKPYSAEDLCAKMGRLLLDDSLRLAQGERGRSRVLRLFTWEAVGEQLAEAYTGVAERKRHAGSRRPLASRAAKLTVARPAVND